MATLIPAPVLVEAAGVPTKKIAEFVGRVSTGTDGFSLAVMESPAGWSELGQRPEFDECTLVLDGELQVETADGPLEVRGGQAVIVKAGEWVRYSTPGTEGARYVSLCLPAFAPGTAHRDPG
jgi:mannose-6-phosphate isomerase-like protein (cupin superfamily)